jgi:hypothetical protein
LVLTWAALHHAFMCCAGDAGRCGACIEDRAAGQAVVAYTRGASECAAQTGCWRERGRKDGSVGGVNAWMALAPVFTVVSHWGGDVVGLKPN